MDKLQRKLCKDEPIFSEEQFLTDIYLLLKSKIAVGRKISVNA